MTSVNPATMLKAIKRLMDTGKLEKGELSKQLLSLARHGNAELLTVFQGSLETKTYTEDAFDHEFFLANAKDIIEEIHTETDGKH